jgi:hypothetical protein
MEDRTLPTPYDVRVFCLAPTVISALDYTKGLGHTDPHPLSAGGRPHPIGQYRQTLIRIGGCFSRNQLQNQLI